MIRSSRKFFHRFLWHDVAGPGEGITRFPRILLDQQADPSRFLRRKILKEQDIKRFGKLGVVRTCHHGIADLPDCEFAALTDIVDGLEKARTTKNSIKYFETASERLFRDADLLSVPEIIAVLNEHVLANHLNLKLMNKLKIELIYDSEKILDLMEVGVVLNAFAHFNITSPRLLSAMMKRADELMESKSSYSHEAVCLVIRSVCKCARLGPKTRPFVSKSLSHLNDMENVSDLALTLRILIDKNFKVPKELVERLKDCQDIETASNMAVLGCSFDVEVVTRNIPGLQLALSGVREGVKCMESIQARNQAAEILARLLSAKRPNEELTKLLTIESVRGMKMHQLRKLAKIYPESIVSLEIARRTQE